jgi:hypothetical protein
MTMPRRHARMDRYALWQFRDYLFDRGAPTLIVSVLFGYLGVAPIRAMISHGLTVTPAMVQRYGSIEAARAATVHDMSAAFLHTFVGSIVFLGALLAMNGIVANDRKLGYFRFLFTKPVSPSRYYGQAFVLHGIGYLLVIALLALVYGAVMVPVLTSSFLAGLGLAYFFYASIAFLLSAAARWDWLSLVAVTVASTLAWEKFGESTHPFAKLLYLLPPVHKTDEVYRAVASGVALPSHTVAWLAGYGACCLAGALVVLRYRRLAIV